MPGMQWLGSVPAKKTGWGYLSDAIRGGTTGYIAGRERRQDIEEKREERKIKLETINYSKKKEAADVVIQALKSTTAEKRNAALAEGSQIRDLIEDVYDEGVVGALLNMDVIGKEEEAYATEAGTQRAKWEVGKEYERKGAEERWPWLKPWRGFIGRGREGNVPAGTSSDPLGLRR